jgi:hypothetical protein
MGQIHSEAQRAHFDKFPTDRKHVEALLHWFDVKYAKRIRSDRKTEVAVYILQPQSEQVSEFLGVRVDRELLYVYSPYNQLQARAVLGLDDIHATYRSRGLNKSLTLLGSDAPDAHQVVQEYLRADLERLPVVGLSRHDLDQIRSGSDVAALFASRHFTRDLFAMESPLNEDAYFFGRESLVQTCLDRLERGQNTGLFGLRRIGKTSVLRAVARRGSSNRLATIADVDLQGVFALRWWSLLEHVALQLAEASGLSQTAVRKLHASAGYREDTAGAYFLTDVRTLVSGAPRGRVCLLLDELHQISFDVSPRPHWNEDFLPFWSVMRSVHQNTNGAFTYILAGVNPYALEKEAVGGHDNPLFGTVKALWVRPFEQSESTEMVRRIAALMGLRFEDALLQELFRQYGGHPFLTRSACSQLAYISKRPSEVSLRTYDDNIRSINRQLLGVGRDRSCRVWRSTTSRSLTF